MTKRGTGPKRPSKLARPSATSTIGARAAEAWLEERELVYPKDWHVEIFLDVVKRPAREKHDGDASRLHISVYPDEWGVYFAHGGKASWVRVTDVAFVHGRDDFKLLAAKPSLAKIGALVRRLEKKHRIQFQRKHALVRTNLPRSRAAIGRWLETL
ncbi:MAG: hypothetical protein HOV81_26920 [Kofleriaceae bacterium]|nr:hypothetical protein [Kofleriaceae bacterium]